MMLIKVRTTLLAANKFVIITGFYFLLEFFPALHGLINYFGSHDIEQ